jgi:hypothetical protein
VRAKATPCLFQVGFFLLDQKEVIQWASKHTLIHKHEMEKQFPLLYRHYLLKMIQEMHEKTNQITRIPIVSTSLSTLSGSYETSGLREAISWVDHVYEMLPTHLIRQAFNKQCHDIRNFKQIFQEKHLGVRMFSNESASSSSVLYSKESSNDAVSIAEVLTPTKKIKQHSWRFACSLSNAVDEKDNVSLVNQIARLELSWESHYETLLTYLSRVQEIEGEHRKSIEEILLRSEQLVANDLQSIQNDFREYLDTLSVEISEVSTSPRSKEIPTIMSFSSRMTRKMKQDQEIEEKIVSRLENLIEFQREMIRLQEKYALFEEEFREIYEKQNHT